MRLEGSVVLVTDANGGIGRAFVVELPKRGRPKSISATFVHAIGAAFVRSQAFRRSVSGILPNGTARADAGESGAEIGGNDPPSRSPRRISCTTIARSRG